MKKNKKTIGLICLFLLIATVSLTGCIETVTTVGWKHGDGTSIILQGAAPTEYQSYPLVDVEFLFDDKSHSESDLDQYTILEPTASMKKGGIEYFEKTIPGLELQKVYYFRAKATYQVIDGNYPSVVVGEEISFSLAQ